MLNTDSIITSFPSYVPLNPPSGDRNLLCNFVHEPLNDMYRELECHFVNYTGVLQVRVIIGWITQREECRVDLSALLGFV